jgi:hypothetical protein
MQRALLVLCLLAAPAYADDDEPLYTCREATGNVEVVFKPDPQLRDVVIWLLGLSCYDVIIDDSVATRVIKNPPTGRMTVAQAKTRGIAAIRAAGLVVEETAGMLVIKPAGKRACPTTGTTAGPVAAPEAADPEPEEIGPTEAQVLAGIKQVSATRAEIKQATVDAVLLNPMRYMKGARILPAMKDGKAQGYKLYAIRPGSLYAKLNFLNGDTLVSINGMEIVSADRGLELYAKLREVKKFAVVVERRGQPVTLAVEIVK